MTPIAMPPRLAGSSWSTVNVHVCLPEVTGACLMMAVPQVAVWPRTVVPLLSSDRSGCLEAAENTGGSSSAADDGLVGSEAPAAPPAPPAAEVTVGFATATGGRV